MDGGLERAILIVEDDVAESSYLQSVLQQRLPDVKLVMEQTPHDGIGAMERQEFDIIIANYLMAGMNGIEFLVQALAMQPKSARVLVTANNDVDLALKAINVAQVSGLLLKPYDIEPLARAIQNLLPIELIQ